MSAGAPASPACAVSQPGQTIDFNQTILGIAGKHAAENSDHGSAGCRQDHARDSARAAPECGPCSMPTRCVPISPVTSASPVRTASNMPGAWDGCAIGLWRWWHRHRRFHLSNRQTRAAFGEAFTIWVDRIGAGRFEDTNRMFVAPERVDLRCRRRRHPAILGRAAFAQPAPGVRSAKPTALFLGRYQPFHPGHQRLIEEGLRRVGQVCIAIRDTHGIDDKNPPRRSFAVKQRIEAALSAYRRPLRDGPAPEHHQRVPWPRCRLHGRTDQPLRATQSISATKLRRLSAGP